MASSAADVPLSTAPLSDRITIKLGWVNQQTTHTRQNRNKHLKENAKILKPNLFFAPGSKGQNSSSKGLACCQIVSRAHSVVKCHVRYKFSQWCSTCRSTYIGARPDTPESSEHYVCLILYTCIYYLAWFCGPADVCKT